MARRATRWFAALSRQFSLAREAHARRNARGIVLLFHEVHVGDDHYARAFKAGCTRPFLDAILGRLRRDQWDIIPLDQVMSRLEQGNTARRFAVVTFDDGYRDTVTRALPVLERHGVPFTVYVPTGAITRELPSWWLGLRALFQQYDTVTVAAMAETFECHDMAAKMAAHADVKSWVRQDYRRVGALTQTFQTYGISLRALNDACFMDESALRTLARHPLAHIGAHTETHPALSLLSRSEAVQEIAGNRRYLETLLDRPVHHFAYPFGTSRTFGDREVSLVADIGFQTAVAAEGGFVSARYRRARHRIPRTEMSGTMAHLPYCFDVLRKVRGNVGR